MHPWEIIKIIGPWAFKKESLSILFKISNGGSMA